VDWIGEGIEAHRLEMYARGTMTLNRNALLYDARVSHVAYILFDVCPALRWSGMLALFLSLSHWSAASGVDLESRPEPYDLLLQLHDTRLLHRSRHEATSVAHSPLLDLCGPRLPVRLGLLSCCVTRHHGYWYPRGHQAAACAWYVALS
jgi:hypothetical protein